MEASRKEFEDISKLIKSELDRFDKEKVEDFKVGVESFLESIIENQKQVSCSQSFMQISKRCFNVGSLVDNCVVGIVFREHSRLKRTRAGNGLSVYLFIHDEHHQP